MGDRHSHEEQGRKIKITEDKRTKTSNHDEKRLKNGRSGRVTPRKDYEKRNMKKLKREEKKEATRK